MRIERLGFIGGGQMAEALIKGLLQKGGVDRQEVTVFDPSKERCDILEEKYGVKTLPSNEEVCNASDILILAVKPQVMSIVLDSIHSYVSLQHLTVSIAAGISVEHLEQGLPSNSRVVRVMPNTPALVNEGAAAVCRGSCASIEDIELVIDIFNTVGIAVQVNESLMDAVTGLSGSGPAYCFSFVQGLIDAGVREGIPRNEASRLAIQTFLGSAVMLKESGKSPEMLTEMVTSPGGTTMEGLFRLENRAFRASIMDAVHGAALKSKELGKQSK